jgi:hypothetical protein
MLSDAFIKNAQPLSDDFSAILVDARKSWWLSRQMGEIP